MPELGIFNEKLKEEEIAEEEEEVVEEEEQVEYEGEKKKELASLVEKLENRKKKEKAADLVSKLRGKKKTNKKIMPYEIYATSGE